MSSDEGFLPSTPDPRPSVGSDFELRKSDLYLLFPIGPKSNIQTCNSSLKVIVEFLSAANPMELIACPDCDLLQELPELPPGAKARCPRCACTVATRMAEPIDLPLALTVTAAIVFIIANTAPLMSLSAVGRYASTTIGGGAKEMLFQGEAITAMIVAFCAVIAPAGYILFMLAVLARRAAATRAALGGRVAARGRAYAAVVDE